MDTQENALLAYLGKVDRMDDRVRVYIDPTAEVSADAEIGLGTKVWNSSQVRERARLGTDCVVGKDVYIDVGVCIGDRVKIQNGAQIFRGVTIEDGVFIGPGVILTNDKQPRAINADGTLKRDVDWRISPTLVQYGAALGAASVILPGVMIGRWAMVAAGGVVTRDVPSHGLAVGHPARVMGFVCRCGARLVQDVTQPTRYVCPACGEDHRVT